MALHEYYCPVCEEFSEHIVAFYAADDQLCDTCGTKLDRQLSVPAKRVTGFAGKAGGRPENWGRDEL